MRVLLVGLGNAGECYDNHRHNVGARLVRAVMDKQQLTASKKKLPEWRLENMNVLLMPPRSYMNECGEAVKQVMDYFDVTAARVYVVHDDVDLARGRIKVKSGGGSAGHNGLRSLDRHIGNGYHRLRVGIGRPHGKQEVKHYVLRDFSKEDEDWLAPLEDKVSDDMDVWLLEGDAAFQQHLQG